MLSNGRIPAFCLTLATLFALAPAALAQQGGEDEPRQDETDPPDQGGDEQGDEQAAEEGGEAESGEPDEAEEEPREELEAEDPYEEPAEEPDEEEPAPELESDLGEADWGEEGGAAGEDFELDMEALGEMDPEEDLTSRGAVDEDEAAAQAMEEWTERELEILELHGYFRVRPELYHKFHMRSDDALFERPMVLQVNAQNDGENNAYLGEDCRAKGSRKTCKNRTLAGANMRLRLEPTLNVSEEIWIKSQIDFLDNVMLGSTPRYYQDYGSGEMIDTASIQGWNMGPPQQDMIVVRRAWGEVMTPLGQLRFGRMGDHWGLGMLHNAGNGIDQDFGDTVDRLMFAAKINDWIFAPAFDFPNEGVSAVSSAGRPFDVSQLDDAYQLVGIIAFKHDEEQQRAMLKRGDAVVNTGLRFTYRSQVLSFERETQQGERYDPNADYHFYRRDMWGVMPDLWFQLLVDTFHLELEAALIYGEVGNPDRDLSDFDEAERLTLTQYGGVLQIDYGLLSDQLRIGLESGFASGDEHVEGLHAPTTFDQVNRPDDGTFGQFAFNPAYNTDLILYRHILGSVSGTYYFRPWLRYDFLRSPMGKKLGVQVDALYSRAIFEESTIHNGDANLGIELDAQVMYVSADNFHAGLKYGVLFPLGAFEGTWDQDMDPSTEDDRNVDRDLSIPQTLQVLLGISF